MKFETNIFFIYCSTGCTCCSNENHYRGPFSSEEIARQKIELYKQMPLLASQYASKGCYELIPKKAHVITIGDETIILTEGGKWFNQFQELD